MLTISASVQWDFPVGHGPYLLSQRLWNHCRLINALNLWILIIRIKQQQTVWNTPRAHSGGMERKSSNKSGYVCQPCTTTLPLRGSRVHYTGQRRTTENFCLISHPKLLFLSQQRKACCSVIPRERLFLRFTTVQTHEAISCQPSVKLSAQLQLCNVVLFFVPKKGPNLSFFLLCTCCLSSISGEMVRNSVQDNIKWWHVSNVTHCNRYNVHPKSALEISTCVVQNGCLLGKSTKGFSQAQNAAFWLSLPNKMLMPPICNVLGNIITSRREEARRKPLVQLSMYISVHRCHQVWRSTGSQLTLPTPWKKFLQQRQNLLNWASSLPEFISSWDVVSLN